MHLIKAAIHPGPSSYTAMHQIKRVDSDVYVDAFTSTVGFGVPPNTAAPLRVSGKLAAGRVTASECVLTGPVLTLGNNATSEIDSSTAVTVLRSADAPGSAIATPVWAVTVANSFNSYDSVAGIAVTTNSMFVGGHYGNGVLPVRHLTTSAVHFELRDPDLVASYVIRYDRSGTPLWAASIDGLNDDYTDDIISDSKGNVIIAGEYRSTNTPINIYNGSGVLVSQFKSQSGQDSAFILKYSASGSLMWGRSLNSLRWSGNGARVTCDASDNVYWNQYPRNGALLHDVSGVQIAQITDTVDNIGSCVLKLDASGTLLWKVLIEGTGYDYGNSVTSDLSGNVYITGSFDSSRCYVYNSSAVPILQLPAKTSASTYTAFVVKCNSSGQPLWAATIGSPAGSVAYGRRVSALSTGDVIVTGSCRYATSGFAFRNTSGDAVMMPVYSVSGTTWGAYVVRYSQSGAPVWNVVIEGKGDEWGDNMMVDGSDNIVVSGSYYSGPTAGNVYVYDPSGVARVTFVPNQSSTADDFYILKLDQDGQPLWGTSINQYHSDAWIRGLNKDPENRIYVSGWYKSTSGILLTDTSGTVVLRSQNNAAANQHGFIAMYDDRTRLYMLPAPIDSSNNVRQFARKVIINKDLSGTAIVRDVSRPPGTPAPAFTIPPNSTKELVWVSDVWREVKRL